MNIRDHIARLEFNGKDFNIGSEITKVKARYETKQSHNEYTNNGIHGQYNA